MSKCIVLVQHKPDKSHKVYMEWDVGSTELEDFTAK